MVIDIYGTSSCSRCRVIKSVLDKNNVSYNYFDLNNVHKAEADAVRKAAKDAGQNSLPIVIVDGEVADIKKIKEKYV